MSAPATATAHQGTVIAVLGAESTGKTTVAQALAEALVQRGLGARCVGEYLREWCDREGRTPRPEEQAAIAAEQTRRIDAAAADGDLVIADTTALMTAVYSDLLFDDHTLYAAALATQRRYTLTLLMALDLPWVADGLQRDGPHVREPVDARVRAALVRSAVPFTVIHGDQGERLTNALNAMNSIAAPAVSTGAKARFDSEFSRMDRVCDRCSDPGCEHRLFSDLLATRAAPGEAR